MMLRDNNFTVASRLPLINYKAENLP